MPRFMCRLVMGLLALTAIGLLIALFRHTPPDTATILALVAAVGLTSHQLYLCARYRYPAEGLIDCFIRRGRERQLEADYAKQDHQQSVAAAASFDSAIRPPRQRTYQVLLRCQHTVVVWSNMPVTLGQLIDCPLERPWGPVVPTPIHLILRPLPFGHERIVHLRPIPYVGYVSEPSTPP